MVEIKFDFNVSERYKYYITKDGKVYKTDTRNNKTTECYYHIAHGYKRIRVTDIDTGLVKDRGGWISTPYENRKHK